MRKATFLALSGAMLASGAGFAQQGNIGMTAVVLSQPAYDSDTGEQHGLHTVVVAKGLVHPFALAMLPNGDALISERGGALRLLRNAAGAPGRPTALDAQPVAGLPAIETAYRNAGLHDVVLHPQFNQNHLVYFTFNKSGGLSAANGATPGRQLSRLSVMRATFDGTKLSDVKEVYLGKAGGTSGSRIALSRDGMLYVEIGAAGGNDAQQLDNTIGKVLRLREDGTVPADNPFVSRSGAQPSIYTYGHRDPLGLTVHPVTGAVLSAEHGPNGGDELNLIVAGGNYGWPRITFGHGYDGAPIGEGPVAPDVKEPLVVWLPSIGPSGLLVYTGDRFPAWKNNLFIGSVRRGEMPGTGGLERLVLNDKMQELRRETLLTDLHQRIRDVRQGADGLIYAITDEADGALLRLEPSATK